MIGNKLEQSIVSVFQNNLTRTYSINEISKHLKKSYPLINHKSNFFLKEGVLRKINVGRSYQCFLNLGNDKTRVLMSINEINNRELFLNRNKDFEIVREKILKICESRTHGRKISFVLIHQSDIMFILPTLEQETINEIQESVPTSGRYKFLFLTEELFKAELLNNEMLQRDHVLMFNIESYIRLLEELVDRLLARGFKNSRTQSGVQRFKDNDAGSGTIDSTAGYKETKNT